MHFRLAIVLLAFSQVASVANVTLPPVFSDNMVVQSGVPLRVWGTADAGETVSVSLGEATIGSATADAAGKWEITGPAQKAGPLPDLVVKGRNTLIAKNVLAGEVWLCSGQSNMRMTVARTSECDYGGVLDAEKEVAEANYPEIRFFTTKWEICSPATVGSNSAVAYFFGRALYKDLKTPVGLLTKAVGGTAVEYWISPKAWTDDLTQKAVKAYEPFFQARKELFQTELANFKKQQAAGKAKGKEPRLITEPEKYPRGFSKLFTDHIAPIAGYPMRGVVWYQGETNTQRSGAYRELLTALISGWRDAWHAPDLPFILVQLANFQPGGANGALSENWPRVRDIQRTVAGAVPHTGMAVAIDAGDPKNLHPPNKQLVGKRAALIALQTVYGKPIESSGPTVKHAEWNGQKILLTFDHAEGGLTAKAEPLSFTVAGADGIQHPATATIQGPQIKVQSPAVPNPTSLRYAWENSPSGIFFNAAGLPAGPFQITRDKNPL